MDNRKQLLEQIKIVINKIEKEYGNELDDGILQTIYIRYKNALEILENEMNINEINITGGVRAYMDSYSDYQNPLLGEIHIAEKMLNVLV
ncbi:lipase chaperone [Virgibacillus halodenitrificans]|uniref:lipase chaperone n=1 Tax=Virgibacillus halodenitrificans TaxID=1482 RepID=UPI0007615DA9|nr:lipase chaperone [Virgibacillus halodenitrificans]WHX26272.1 lipase chaperone [Virgibacillus halodenitrificans]